MLELLQIKHRKTIVLCGLGNFYIARGKDAILLHELANLKLTCLEAETCKVGFPIASLEKYTDILEQKQFNYVVYYYEKSKKELEFIKQYQGKNKNEIKRENMNCYLCKATTKYYKKTDEYIEAVAKLYQKEELERGKEKNEAKTRKRK